ncbi:3-hydroxyacyl-CoA dehydrogenase family protein [Actinoplanes sp. GCM10030250]|uniref:3-hydroxyacyl-CoA dehydrogenase family protein n=1 Tax=Actinoplanes sp. GCM10030250 TaxID=3273376 RepID=UPI00361A1B41
MGSQPIVVLGAGVMGTSITSLLTARGHAVLLVDVDPRRRAAAAGRIEQQTRMARMLGALPDGAIAGGLRLAGDLTGAHGADTVIEAVTEDAAVKAKVLAEVSTLVAADAVLVTNTSSIPVDELAGVVERPAALIGTHFMNPAYLIRTVEVIRGPRTGEPALAAVRALLAGLGREAVVVRDAPGFVTSRVLHPMINTAARVVQDGTATPDDVDTLMHGCLGHPTGPLRTADLIGLDNLVDSLRVLHERTGDESCRPCDLLLDKVAAGQHGRKSGRGFYDYGEPLS